MREILQIRVNYLKRVLNANKRFLSKRFSKSLEQYILHIKKELIESEKMLNSI